MRPSGEGPVVYVDDEPSLCRIFALRMQSLGIVVETFTEPLEAVAYVNAHPVACVLCDYRMPRLSGLDVLERIERDVAFYLVTGDIAMDDEVAASPRLQGILHKPVCFEEIAALVRPGGVQGDASAARRG